MQKPQRMSLALALWPPVKTNLTQQTITSDCACIPLGK